MYQFKKYNIDLTEKYLFNEYVTSNSSINKNVALFQKNLINKI